MKFIVEPQKEATQDKKPGGGPCGLYITMCALCDEDPRFCDGPIPI